MEVSEEGGGKVVNLMVLSSKSEFGWFSDSVSRMVFYFRIVFG